MSEQHQFHSNPGYTSQSAPSTRTPQPSKPFTPLPPFTMPTETGPDFELSSEYIDTLQTDNILPPTKTLISKRLARFIAPALALLIVGAIAFVWLAPTASSPSSPLSTITQQSFTNNPGTSSSATPSGGNLHVYVVGAVKHPGIYVLPPGARVYQLIAAAGGTLPQANLVALNMAASLTDGQEVYVLSNGEVPPTYLGGVPGPTTSGTVTASGQPLNINTASLDQMRQVLHVSSATAQKIIDYRAQHGPYTSVDQLLQVISKSIYDRIRNQVTI